MKNHSTITKRQLRRSSTTHLSGSQKIPFRTLLKRRNCTIGTAQLYEDSSFQRQLSHSKAVSQSHISQTNRKSTPAPALNIKQYTKQMKSKQEQKPLLRCDSSKRQVEMQDDKLSTRSGKSTFFTNEMAKSIVIKQKRQRLTIEEIQKKIEQLIGANFVKFKKQRTQIGLSKWLQISLETNLQKQLENIIQNLNLLRQEMKEGEEERLETLNRKIQILESMLASEATQSQILKSQYFGWINQRSNTTSFINKKLLATNKKINGDGKLQISKQILSSQNRSANSFLDFASTSKISYKKPSKDYYFQHKKSKHEYTHNHQPMCRSSYSAQYLNYGSIPTYSYKPDQTKQYPDASIAIKASTYQQEYKQKLGLTNNINFKELDCYRDKFKNTNISFMNSSKKQYYEKLTKNLKKKTNQKAKKQNQKQIANQKNKKVAAETTYSLINLSTCGSFYKSQHHKQFIWHNTRTSQTQHEDALLKSEIKDKQLLKLKANYKALAIRS